MSGTLRLLTRDGEFVANVDSPGFTEPPQVVVFGSRTFVLRTDGSYYEAFVWAVPGAAAS